jgi:hypothetical protein
VERNKEGDGFVRLRWGETKEQDAAGGARLTIEIGAEFRFSRTFDDPTLAEPVINVFPGRVSIAYRSRPIITERNASR